MKTIKIETMNKEWENEIAERDAKIENSSLDEEISSFLTAANSALRENANCGNYIFYNIGEIWVFWNSLKFK